MSAGFARVVDGHEPGRGAQADDEGAACRRALGEPSESRLDITAEGPGPLQVSGRRFSYALKAARWLQPESPPHPAGGAGLETVRLSLQVTCTDAYWTCTATERYNLGRVSAGISAGATALLGRQDLATLLRNVAEPP